LGYFWLLKRDEKDMKRLIAVAALMSSLFVVYLLLFLERGVTIPAFTVRLIILVTSLGLVSGAVLGTALEIWFVGSHVASGGRLWRLMGWDKMGRMPKQDIARKFLFANYHELMFALIGIFLGLLLHN
jgi:hypothetical protein